MTEPAGVVLSVQLLDRHGEPPRAVAEARALPEHGLEGDLHSRGRAGGSRQVLLLDRGALEAAGLRPGDLREQITVDFPPLETLAPGTLLQVGQAVLELTGPCEPCTHIGALNGVADREAFRDALRGRRGQLARVVRVEGRGTIRVGDRVAVWAPVPR
ncbi:MAG TPA: MOSC domain-containing protein [bacterium]|nr:MOSC domain-containing protein [bacterium]